MSTLKSLHQELLKAHNKVQQEKLQLIDIKMGNEYQDLQAIEDEMMKEVDDLKRKRLELLETVPDSSTELFDIKQLIIEAMKLEQREEYENVKAKFSVKKQVNAEQLITALEGDLTQFMKLAKPTQKAVTDFAKALDPEHKKKVMRSIEVVSREMTDISITPPNND